MFPYKSHPLKSYPKQLSLNYTKKKKNHQKHIKQPEKRNKKNRKIIKTDFLKHWKIKINDRRKKWKMKTIFPVFHFYFAATHEKKLPVPVCAVSYDIVCEI